MDFYHARPKFFFSQRTATHHKQFIRDGRNKEKEANLHVDRKRKSGENVKMEKKKVIKEENKARPNNETANKPMLKGTVKPCQKGLEKWYQWIV